MARASWLAPGVLILGAWGGAAAQTPPTAPTVLTTGTLTELCASAPTRDDDAGTIFCRGFMLGVGQYHNSLSATRGGLRLYCIPQDATLQGVQSAFVAWARANPGFAQDKAVDGLMRFASSTWPCPAAPAPASTRRTNR